MQVGEVAKFNNCNELKFVKPLGKGGTGEIRLFYDEIMDMHFAIKKYSPYDTTYLEEFYERFIDEIKILFRISHPNIVRIYNYYLYPAMKTGYLQMEYIVGTPIDEADDVLWLKDWSDIFKDVIDAFVYLEQKKILHRDIRPANILIDEHQEVKIIDFGFGKKLEKEEVCGGSVILNWPVTELPDEVKYERVYSHQSEIYFIGKLFKSVLKDKYSNFEYKNIIEKMIKHNLQERFKSFFDIKKEISKGILSRFNFTTKQKKIYQEFTDYLICKIRYFRDEFNNYECDIVITKLEKLIKNNILEEILFSNTELISCFTSSGYQYNNKRDIPMKSIKEFYSFFINLEEEDRQIVLENIYYRLSKISIQITEEDNLPF